MGWLERKVLGGLMTMTEWLARTFWQAFASWVEKDPDAAAQRVGRIMEDVVERVVAAQEAALDAQGETDQ